MTQVIQIFDIENGAPVTLDAPDVRTVLDTFSDEPFNFTPQAANAGYFFIESTRSIVVRKYAEALNGISLENNPHRGLLLDRTVRVSASNIDLSATQHPEELFGQGSHLLTTEGSPVAIAVQVIRNYADFPLSWDNLKDETWGKSNLALLLLSGGLQDHLDALMAEYHPSNTLYVNNSLWRTTAEAENTIKRIVFSPATSHVPKMDTPNFTLSNQDIVLPRRIRSIGEQAFASLTHNNGVSIVLPQSLTVVIHPNALSENQNLAAGARTTLFESSQLIDYSAFVNMTVDDGKLSYNLEALPIRNQVIGYEVLTTGNVFRINIFTQEGLVGFATNRRVITYYYNFPGEYGTLTQNLVFTTITTIGSKLVLPEREIDDKNLEALLGDEYKFSHWSLSPDGGVPLEDKVLLTIENGFLTFNVSVYAQWCLDPCPQE